MSAELILALAALAAALLVARTASGRAAEPDPEAAARRFVETRIDAHVGRLSEDYLETVPDGTAPDDVPPDFAKRIESFIGNVILWDALTAVRDDATSAAIRELVVTERASIYERILDRVHTRLATER